MRCVYCYDRDKRSDYTFDELVKIVEAIFCNRQRPASLEFLGGEALLRFDLLSDIILYVRRKYPTKIDKIWVTSNGTIVTNEILDFFRDNGVILNISIDGDVEANSQRRWPTGMPSHETVMNNVRRSLRHGVTMSCQLTVHSANVKNLSRSVAFLYDAGFRLFVMGLVNGVNSIGMDGDYKPAPRRDVRHPLEIDSAFSEIFEQEIRKVSAFQREHLDLELNLFAVRESEYETRRIVAGRDKILFQKKYVASEVAEITDEQAQVLALKQLAYDIHWGYRP